MERETNAADVGVIPCCNEGLALCECVDGIRDEVDDLDDDEEEEKGPPPAGGC